MQVYIISDIWTQPTVHKKEVLYVTMEKPIFLILKLIYLNVLTSSIFLVLQMRISLSNSTFLVVEDEERKVMLASEFMRLFGALLSFYIWTNVVMDEKNKILMKDFDDGLGAYAFYFSGNLPTITMVKHVQDQIKEEVFNLISSQFDQKSAQMIVLHGYPLAMVEHVGLKAFVKNLQPLFNVVPTSTTEQSCIDIYVKENQEVYDMLDLIYALCVLVQFWKNVKNVTALWNASHLWTLFLFNGDFRESLMQWQFWLLELEEFCYHHPCGQGCFEGEGIDMVQMMIISLLVLLV